jgi:orotidine-5'-phosphate decarboxylase
VELIARHPTVIPACDVDENIFPSLIADTADIPGIGAYKIGAALALKVGLPNLVKITREHTDKPIIYDHQKAATDIPDTAEFFMDVLAASGVNAVILFPLSGPATQSSWTAAAQQRGIHVIVGGYMTHHSFLSRDGGYVADKAPDAIYIQAAEQQVSSFVVPGTKPKLITHVRERLAPHCSDPVFYSPGFVAQRGEVAEAARAAGDRWHAIVGRGIYNAPSMREAAQSIVNQL